MESKNGFGKFTNHWLFYAYVAGVAAALAALAALASMLRYELCAAISGGVSAIFAIVLTAVITANQDKESADLKQLTSKVDETVGRIEDVVGSMKGLQQENWKLLLELTESGAKVA